MTHRDIASALGTSSLFCRLDEQGRNALAARCTLHAYRHGQPVFLQGDPGDDLFLVLSGAVKLFVSSPDGEEVLIAVCRPVEAFGEIAVIDGGTRSAGAEAVEDSKLIVLSRGVLAESFRDEPAVAEALLWALVSTLRRITDRTTDLVFLDLASRLAKLLLALADAQALGQSDTGPLHVDLGLTQSDLAHMVGGSRQAINRILAGYERRGIITRDGKRLILTRSDELRRRART